MRLTPEVLAATYTFLRETLPFKRWKLPEAEAVEFHIKRFKHMADAIDLGHKTVIRFSERRMSHTSVIVSTMAHEMVHIHLDRNGVRAAHGPQFKRAWVKVCDQHGFDPMDIS